MKSLIILILLFASSFSQAQNLSAQIAAKEAELVSLKKLNAQDQAPHMYTAMTEMVKASSTCVADGISSKGRFTRAAAVSKACREQAQVGVFAICAATVAQTGDTRDLNQCVAMMQNQGNWEQVWMRGLGILGMVAGTRELGDVIVPLATAAINKNPANPIIVRPEVVNPEVVNPVIVNPEIVTPVVIETAAPAL